MKKSFVSVVSLILAVLFVTAFAACKGETPAARDYNVDELAKSVAENVSFEDQYLEKIDAQFGLNLYSIDPALVADKDGAKDAAVYISGSSPEMIVFVKAVDNDSANTVLESVEKLIDTYITNYTNYGPDQVKKLETAVKTVKGQYVFVIVSNDNNAAKNHLNELLGK